MSNAQNLAYAVAQVLHNFGAVAAVGGSLAATKIESADGRKKFAWLALAGWGAQAVSGAGFGLVSYYFYHQFPDIAGIAVVALGIKMLCTATGFLLVATYLFRGANWPERKGNAVLLPSVILAATALSAAAFLRWFS